MNGLKINIAIKQDWFVAGCFRLFAMCLALIVPFALAAQEKQYTLKGNAKIKGGDNYPYQITFSFTGSVIKGYSITKQPDGSEMKAKIRGRINKKEHSFSFIETGPVGRIPDGLLAQGIVNCMFSGRLIYKLRGGKYVISGAFTSKNDQGGFCGAGTLELEEPDIPGAFFHEQNIKKQSTPAAPQKKDSLLVKEPVTDTNKITEGIDKKIEWHSDKCLVEIWDGGVIDGDVVTLMLNNKAVLTDYTLTKDKKQICLQLTGKVNIITIVAGDEGSAPPNTAEMILTDGNDQYRVTTYNKKGKTANVIIIKK